MYLYIIDISSNLKSKIKDKKNSLIMDEIINNYKTVFLKVQWIIKKLFEKYTRDHCKK